MSYLEDHGINSDTATKFGLKEIPGEKLIIPIKDYNGNFLFNKYRWLGVNSSAKFSYDAGNKTALFNSETLRGAKGLVILTEGEVDAVRLEQEGFKAASATSGAGSFNKDWIKWLIGWKVYVCYDNDEAGERGSSSVAKILKENGVDVYEVHIPKTPGVKDICDYFRQNSKEEFLEILNGATEFTLPLDIKLISLGTLLNTEFPEQKWLIDSLIPLQGLVAISGTPGSYKTWITEYIALCVSEGQPLFGKFSTSQGNVLIIDKENSRYLIKDRFKSLGADSANNIYFLDEDFLVEDEEIITRIIRVIKQYEIKLIIMDSFIRIHQGEENSATDMSEVFRVLKQLIDEGSSILFTHHHRKQGFIGKTNNTDSLRGSTDILAALDCHLAVDKLEDGIKVTQAKLRQKEALNPFKIRLEPVSSELQPYLTFTYLGEINENKEKIEDVRELILNILSDVKEHSRQEIMELLKDKYGRTIVDSALQSFEPSQVKVRTGERNKKFYQLIEVDVYEVAEEYESPWI